MSERPQHHGVLTWASLHLERNVSMEFTWSNQNGWKSMTLDGAISLKNIVSPIKAITIEKSEMTKRHVNICVCSCFWERINNRYIPIWFALAYSVKSSLSWLVDNRQQVNFAQSQAPFPNGKLSWKVLLISFAEDWGESQALWNKWWPTHPQTINSYHKEEARFWLPRTLYII